MYKKNSKKSFLSFCSLRQSGFVLARSVFNPFYRLLKPKFINGFLIVFFAGLKQRCREIFVMDRVGVMLRFQSYTRVAAKLFYTVNRQFGIPVAGVQLHSGLGGKNFDLSSAVGFS